MHQSIPAGRGGVNATPWAQRLRNGHALLRRIAPERADALDDLQVPHGEMPVAFAPWPGARHAVVTFAGNAGRLILPEDLTARAGLHIIAVRDPARCFGLSGIPGLGDTYLQCVATLEAMIAAMRAQRLHCLGVSAGGYPALRYGLDLRADGVLAFCPPTTLDLADDRQAPLSRYPQLARLYRHLPNLPLDLARCYAAAKPRPRVIAVYDKGHERDSWLAERLAGIAGVDLRGVTEPVGHRVFHWLSETGGLSPLLEQMLALRPIAGAAAAAAE